MPFCTQIGVQFAFILFLCSFCTDSTFLYIFIAFSRGVGEGGAGGGAQAPPTFKSGGGGAQVGLCPPPPLFGQSKCSNFTICSYFVVKNTFFSKF